MSTDLDNLILKVYSEIFSVSEPLDEAILKSLFSLLLSLACSYRSHIGQKGINLMLLCTLRIVKFFPVNLCSGRLTDS